MQLYVAMTFSLRLDEDNSLFCLELVIVDLLDVSFSYFKKS